MQNGVSLILVTITLRLLRVYRIFICTERQKIGKCWKNAPFVVIAATVSLIPNLFCAIYVANLYYFRSTLLYSVSIALNVTFLYPFIFFTLLLAIRTRKIKYKNFKDTNKITFFIAFMINAVTVTVPTIILFAVRGNAQAASASQIIMMLVATTACQLTLFTPKLLPVLREKFSRNVEISSAITTN